MSTWLAVIIAKPLGALMVYFPIRCATEALRRRMPDGALKRILFFSWGR